ncbi:MAG: hypothetical protein WBG69_04915, partial [Arcobacteraceae bacterium]
TLIGNGGDDVLYGESGDDTFKGGTGNDTIVGGDNVQSHGDLVDYSQRTEGVEVTLDSNGTTTAYIDTDSDGLAVHTIGEEQDTLTGIENISGSQVADDITGDEFANTIIGNSGADTLSGGAGDDKIQGGDDDDIITGGAGADTLYGDAGDDRFTQTSTLSDLAGDKIYGGTNTNGIGDTVDYSNLSDSLVINLRDTGLTSVTVGNTTDGDHQIAEIENVTGSSADDTIEGNSSNNILDGDAGTGDVLSYDNTQSSVVVNLSGTAINSDLDLDGTTANTNISAQTAIGTASGTDTVTNFENIQGSDYSDILIGSNGINTIKAGLGDDLLYGGTSNDVLDGESGNDTVSYALETSSSVNISLQNTTATVAGTNNYTDSLVSIENAIGTSGDDTIEGSTGANTLKGGAGNDTLSYANAISSDNSGVFVDLSDADGVIDTVNAGIDTISGFENILGSAKDDTLIGDNNINTIIGGTGNDTITGKGGLDTLKGGTGNDIFKISDADVDGVSDDIDGEGNTDTLDYSSLSSTYHIDVNLVTPSADILNTSNVTQDTDTIAGIENVIGTSNSDTITGDANSNKLEGGAGNDIIDGGAGVDSLYGDAGDDTFTQRDGETTGDYIDGGTASEPNGDTVDYSNVTASVNLTLKDGGLTNTVQLGGSDDHIIKNIENITGSTAGDTIVGNSSKNTLLGGDGDDTIDGGLGADYLDGQGATNGNVLSYNSIAQSVRVDLGNNSAITDLNNDGFTYDGSGNNTDSADEQDTVLNFKTVIGSTVGDTLIAGNSGNTLLGSGGEDTLIAGSGADVLDGGLNADTFILNADDAEDKIIGGTGKDTVDYSSLGAANQITLTLDGAEIQTVSINGKTADKIQDVENVLGTQGADNITGDVLANSLVGNAGNDTLDGGAGKDTLRGGADDDILKGGSDVDSLFGDDGDDTLDGGTGIDYLDGGSQTNGGGDFVSFSSQAEKLQLNLKEVDGSGYSQALLDNIGDDYLKDIENITATNQSDTIVGNASINTIVALNGDDTITGDGGDDHLFGGEGDDVFKAGIYDAINNTLGAGDDGADTIDGGTGTESVGDTVDYSTISKSINVTLAGSADTDATVTITDYTNDTIRNIENVTGSQVNDIINGNIENNTLKGEAGDDTLYGAGGDDVLDGGDNIDTADYSSANTAITVDMSITAGEVVDDGDTGTDNLIAIEKIIGSTKDDKFTGSDSLNDTFIGNDGYDKFYGSKGNDTYYSYLETNNDDGDYSKVDYSGSTLGKIKVDLGQTTSDGTIDYSTVYKLYNSAPTALDFTNPDNTDRLYGISNVTGTTYNDTITGNAQGNKLEGDGGDDIITGADGVDLLDGGAGADTFVATSSSDGADVIDGGADKDTVDYSALDASHNISSLTLLEAGNSTTVNITNGDNDNITSFENVVGTQGIDNIIGNSEANILKGQGGNDSLYGKDGDDSLYGEDGDDTLKGGVGDDYLDGGTNTAIGDTVDYSDATSAVTVD